MSNIIHKFNAILNLKLTSEPRAHAATIPLQDSGGLPDSKHGRPFSRDNISSSGEEPWHS